MISVEPFLTTAEPTIGHAPLVRTRYQQELRRSLLACLHAVSGDFEAELEAARTWASSLEVERALAPWVHARYFALHAALHAGRDETTIELIDELSRSTLEWSHVDDLHIEGMPEDRLERAVLWAALEANNYEGGAYDAHAVRSLDDEFLREHEGHVRQALAMLRQLDAAMYEEVDALVTRISLVEDSPASSMTDVQTFGRVYLHRAREGSPVLFYLENLVHEASHLRLHAMMALDPLVTNPVEERYEAPLRLDARPMVGIFHATFVLSRVVRLFRRLAASAGPHLPQARERLEDVERRLARGLAVVEAHAMLTEAGAWVVRSLRETASEGPEAGP